MVELMLVLGIILMILGLVAPSMGGILKGKKIEQAIASVNTALESARMEAISQNSYVWVGVLNVAPANASSGQDELWLLNFKSTAPSPSRVPTESSGGKSIPVSPLTRIEGVSMVKVDTLPKTVFDVLPLTAQDPNADLSAAEDSATPIYWTNGDKKKDTTFTKLVLFTPRGEAIRDSGTLDLPSPAPYICIGLAQTINGRMPPTTKDAAAVIVSGFSGRISTIRP